MMPGKVIQGLFEGRESVLAYFANEFDLGLGRAEEHLEQTMIRRDLFIRNMPARDIWDQRVRNKGDVNDRLITACVTERGPRTPVKNRKVIGKDELF